jgi:NAD(P) transhydrogenase
MAVVGGGVIGIEYASMFARLGVPVTLIERRQRPLDFLDREIVEELIHQMRARNVTFSSGRSSGIHRDLGWPAAASNRPPRVRKRIISDVVLFSAGRLAATGPLELGAAGVGHDERGPTESGRGLPDACPIISLPPGM